MKYLKNKTIHYDGIEDNKILRSNFNQVKVKDLYNENNILLKEIGDNTNGKIYCVCGLEELILLKCPYSQSHL